MPKKKRYQNSKPIRTQRDIRDPNKYRSSRRRLRSSFLKSYKFEYDRRRWTPVEIYHDTQGRPLEFTATDPQKKTPYKKKDPTKDRIGPKNPLKAMVCRRRRSRRETLFALTKIGRGKGGTGRRRLNETSWMRC